MLVIFFYAISSRKLGNISAVFYSGSFSALVLSSFILIAKPTFQVNLQAIYIAILAGFLHTIANFSFSKGLSVGKISLVTPVAAGYSILLVFAAIFIYKELLAPFQLISITIIIIGTIIASTDISQFIKSKKLVLSDPGIPYALTTFLFWAIGFFFLTQSVKQVGWVIPNLVLYLTQTACITAYAMFIKTNIKIPKTSITKTAVTFNGIANVGGYVAFSIGVQRGLTSIVAPIASAFPAITVILARLLFKEKITRLQTFGIIAIISGVVLLSI